MASPDPFKDAVKRVLRPLVRLMIVRGVRYPVLGDLLKEVYLEVSSQHFRLKGKRLTDSRVSLLTGLQRKDVKSLRAQIDSAPVNTAGSGAGPMPGVLARWMSGEPFADENGAARTLARAGPGASFESLVAEVCRDIHPRTVLDELARQGLVECNPDDGSVRLIAPAYLPSRDEEALLGYFGANLGDHAETAVTNVLSAPEAGPLFERAVHYNNLTKDALDELEALAQKLQSGVLRALNTKAAALQGRDADSPLATGRFRCGAFVLRSLDKATAVED